MSNVTASRKWSPQLHVYYTPCCPRRRSLVSASITLSVRAPLLPHCPDSWRSAVVEPRSDSSHPPRLPDKGGAPLTILQPETAQLTLILLDSTTAFTFLGHSDQRNHRGSPNTLPSSPRLLLIYSPCHALNTPPVHPIYLICCRLSH